MEQLRSPVRYAVCDPKPGAWLDLLRTILDINRLAAGLPQPLTGYADSQVESTAEEISRRHMMGATT